jgi:hypothetical protein
MALEPYVVRTIERKSVWILYTVDSLGVKACAIYVSEPLIGGTVVIVAAGHLKHLFACSLRADPHGISLVRGEETAWHGWLHVTLPT